MTGYFKMPKIKKIDKKKGLRKLFSKKKKNTKKFITNKHVIIYKKIIFKI